MSTKLQTSSAVLFDKLAGAPYTDGALTFDTVPRAFPPEGVAKDQTLSTILFGKLAGAPYVDDKLFYDTLQV